MPETHPDLLRDTTPEDLAKLTMCAFADITSEPTYTRYRDDLHTKISHALTDGIGPKNGLPFTLQLLAAADVCSQMTEAAAASLVHATSANATVARGPQDDDLYRLALADFFCESLSMDMRKRVNLRLLELGQASQGASS